MTVLRLMKKSKHHSTFRKELTMWKANVKNASIIFALLIILNCIILNVQYVLTDQTEIKTKAISPQKKNGQKKS